MPRPTFSWADASEIVAGMLLNGSLSKNAIRFDSMIEPYNRLGKVYARSNGHAPPESEIIEVLGPEAYRQALEVATRYKKLPANWVTLLDRASTSYTLGQTMKRAGEKLMAGESLTAGNITSLSTAIHNFEQDKNVLTPLDQIKVEKNHFTLSGYPPLDEHLGGLPKSGLTIIAGPPGTGKTFLATELALAFVKSRKARTDFYTMEMTSGQIAERIIHKRGLSPKLQKLIYVSDYTLGVEELSTISARSGNAELILVDYAERMLVEGISEEQAARIYYGLSDLAKNLAIPVVLVAQLNRNYDGRLPRITDIRYSGAAEQAGALIMLVVNSDMIMISPEANAALELQPNEGALLIGKSKFGYRSGTRYKHNTPGAICIEWLEEGGWGNKHRWRAVNNDNKMDKQKGKK